MNPAPPTCDFREYVLQALKSTISQKVFERPLCYANGTGFQEVCKTCPIKNLPHQERIKVKLVNSPLKRKITRENGLNEIENLSQLKRREMAHFIGAIKKELDDKYRKKFCSLLSTNPCVGDMPQ